MDKRKNDSRPHVTIIGTSNTNGIDPHKLSSRYTANKITAYTISETETEVNNLTSTPDVIVLHSITNDIKSDTPSNCVDKMTNLVRVTSEKFPDSKIIISLPTPRSDDSTHNNNSQIISAMLKEEYKDHSMISLCDNSNLAYKGEPIAKYFVERDGVHLTADGVSVFASNIRFAVDKALDIPKRAQPPYRGRRGYYRGGRGRFDNGRGRQPRRR